MIVSSEEPHAHPDTESHETVGPSYWFRGYGLLFRSSFPVPEMTAVDPARLAPCRLPDVTISAGPVPEHLDAPTTVGALHEATPEEFLLRVRDVGRFLVSHGRAVMVEPLPSATDHDVRVFLLGSCLGGLLHQRGFLVLHASGIGTDHGAVLFAGESGAGKSTLLAELLRRGMRMMVDDVAGITVDAAGRPIVVPSYPRTRLWSDTARRLSIDTEGLRRTRDNMDKYERQLPDQFWDREAPLIRVYHLAGSNGEELSLTPLGPFEAFETLLSNTYRQVLLDSLSRRHLHFELASLTARFATVIRVIRPAEPFLLTELADLIMQDLRDD